MIGCVIVKLTHCSNSTYCTSIYVHVGITATIHGMKKVHLWIHLTHDRCVFLYTHYHYERLVDTPLCHIYTYNTGSALRPIKWEDYTALVMVAIYCNVLLTFLTNQCSMHKKYNFRYQDSIVCTCLWFFEMLYLRH